MSCARIQRFPIAAVVIALLVAASGCRTDFQGIDVASHDFTRYVFGGNINEKREPQVDASEIQLAMERVEAMYSRVDGLVGGPLERATEQTHVIVVSDHGWEYDGTSHSNFNPGVLIAAGPRFQKGVRADEVSVLDVLPLMLTILEVPLSRDFDGRLPEELFVADVGPTAEWVENYPMDPVALSEDVEAESSEDEMMLERLRGLGYTE